MTRVLDTLCYLNKAYLYLRKISYKLFNNPLIKYLSKNLVQLEFQRAQKTSFCEIFRCLIAGFFLANFIRSHHVEPFAIYQSVIEHCATTSSNASHDQIIRYRLCAACPFNSQTCFFAVYLLLKTSMLKVLLINVKKCKTYSIRLRLVCLGRRFCGESSWCHWFVMILNSRRWSSVLFMTNFCDKKLTRFFLVIKRW